MDALQDALVHTLEEFGLHVDVSQRALHDAGPDVDLELSRGDTHQKFTWVLKHHATLSSLGHEAGTGTGNVPVLIGTGSVSARSADAFRRAGIQYVDTAGNAWIQFGDVLIDIRGRRSSTGEVPGPGTRSPGGNLFSTGRAQVAFVLLQWPALWKKPQRDIAEAAGVSLGQANNALKLFRSSGFGPGGHRTRSEFLDLWVASFPTGLARKLVLATYRGSIDDFRKVGAEDPVFLSGAVVSGEVAAEDQLRPTALTIYVPALDPMLSVKNRWRSDGDANVTVRRKFWTTPPGETHHYDGPLVGLRNAPDVLVYADLTASDDPRAREAAKEWRSRLVGLRSSD